jgi:hypothetical protein
MLYIHSVHPIHTIVKLLIKLRINMCMVCWLEGMMHLRLHRSLESTHRAHFGLWYILLVQNREIWMRFHELRASDLVKGSAVFSKFDHADPLPPHFGHGCGAADDAEAIVDQPD